LAVIERKAADQQQRYRGEAEKKAADGAARFKAKVEKSKQWMQRGLLWR
jgi:hypothetical protein